VRGWGATSCSAVLSVGIRPRRGGGTCSVSPRGIGHVAAAFFQVRGEDNPMPCDDHGVFIADLGHEPGLVFGW